MARSDPIADASGPPQHARSNPGIATAPITGSPSVMIMGRQRHEITVNTNAMTDPPTHGLSTSPLLNFRLGPSNRIRRAAALIETAHRPRTTPHHAGT